ncbi:hypothetical protein UCDDA912_g03437 [Diaporthe ampelina]|uniref:Uncharacterized protein n=1 Tax=Diaporthe ampelina TaxID=1214573 RepID=A0A0G2FQP6_9PEZI|nr:hypothetical protein UCDDA912_g03437 [Diaporthe ampelina]
MADIASDDDPDSAAMAEAMGFTGFGMQRAANRKRKLTPPSQTGANSAPLGKRRPLNLPEPVSAGRGGNAEEIGLDDDDDDGSGGDVGAQDGGGEAGGDIWAQAGLDALSVSDAPPATGPLQHQLPAKPPPQQQQQQQQQQQRQNQNQTRHAGKASRHPGGGPGRTPWWEGEWDPRLVGRMVENPWERLEKQRGLEARGTWPHGGGGGGGDAPAPAPAPAGGAGLAGGAVGSVGGGIEAAAQATTVS